MNSPARRTISLANWKYCKKIKKKKNKKNSKNYFKLLTHLILYYCIINTGHYMYTRTCRILCTIQCVERNTFVSLSKALPFDVIFSISVSSFIISNHYVCVGNR